MVVRLVLDAVGVDDREDAVVEALLGAEQRRVDDADELELVRVGRELGHLAGVERDQRALAQLAHGALLNVARGLEQLHAAGAARHQQGVHVVGERQAQRRALLEHLVLDREPAVVRAHQVAPVER